MERRKGSKNNASDKRPVASSLSPDERIRLLANLVIDRIVEDQRNGRKLYIKIKEKYHGVYCQS